MPNIINPKVTEYINGLYAPVSAEMGNLRSEAEADRVPIILRDTETFLMTFVKGILSGKNPSEPFRILEVGAAVGYSALIFAACGDSVQVDTIERDEAAAEKARSNFKAFGLEKRIRLHEGDAGEILQEMLADSKASGLCCDLMFIDAGKSHYREYFDAGLSLVRSGGVIISDNVLLKGGTASDEYDPRGRFKTSIRNMRDYLSYITSCSSVYTSVLPVGDGTAISVLL